MNKLSILLLSNFIVVSPLFASFLSFPCELDNSQSAHMVIVDRDKDSIYDLACAGSAYVGAAGHAESDSNSLEVMCRGRRKYGHEPLLFGLQNQMTSGFLGGLNSYFLLVDQLKKGKKGQNLLAHKLAFVFAVGESHLSRLVWRNARETLRQRLESFVNVIDDYVLTAESTGSLPENSLISLKDNHVFISNTNAFVTATRMYAKEMFSVLHGKNLLSSAEVRDLSAFLNDPHNLELNEVAAKITIAIQSRVIADNLMQLYCKAKGSGKPVYAIVGAGQILDLKSMLLTASGGKVRFADGPKPSVNFTAPLSKHEEL